MQPIKKPLEVIDAYDCWSSSRLDRLWRFDWWSTVGISEPHKNSKQGRDFGGYPC